MPIFEYRCNDCAADFELLQRVNDADSPTTKCPRCGTQNATRRFSTFATEGTRKQTDGDNAA